MGRTAPEDRKASFNKAERKPYEAKIPGLRSARDGRTSKEKSLNEYLPSIVCNVRIDCKILELVPAIVVQDSVHSLRHDGSGFLRFLGSWVGEIEHAGLPL